MCAKEDPIGEYKRLHEDYKYYEYGVQDLANYLQVSRKTVHNWLKGDSKPNAAILRKISEYLKNYSPRF